MSPVIRICLLSLLLCLHSFASATNPHPIVLNAFDGIVVYGLEYKAETPRAVILFHQAGSNKVQFIPKMGGVHGFSTLRGDKNSKGKEENWQAVLTFLKNLKF